MSQILTTITHEGQQYLDEEVYVEVSKAKPLDVAVAALFDRYVPAKIEQFDHYERVQLRWMKPDGNGGLVQRA